MWLGCALALTGVARQVSKLRSIISRQEHLGPATATQPADKSIAWHWLAALLLNTAETSKQDKPVPCIAMPRGLPAVHACPIFEGTHISDDLLHKPQARRGLCKGRIVHNCGSLHNKCMPTSTRRASPHPKGLRPAAAPPLHVCNTCPRPH